MKKVFAEINLIGAGTTTSASPRATTTCTRVSTCSPRRAPGLHGTLLAAKHAGHSHVSIDGALIETDRLSMPGPSEGVDLWWSGKHGNHGNHGGNIQVITAPGGWPLWISQVRPGREHDTTAVRVHTEILPALAEAGGDLRTLGDLGYEGESDTITVAFKKPKAGKLTTRAAAVKQGPQRPTSRRRDRRCGPRTPPLQRRPDHMTTLSLRRVLGTRSSRWRRRSPPRKLVAIGCLAL